MLFEKRQTGFVPQKTRTKKHIRSALTQSRKRRPDIIHTKLSVTVKMNNKIRAHYSSVLLSGFYRRSLPAIKFVTEHSRAGRARGRSGLVQRPVVHHHHRIHENRKVPNHGTNIFFFIISRDNSHYHNL